MGFCAYWMCRYFFPYCHSQHPPTPAHVFPLFLLQVFERQGFAPLEPPYLASWMHSGQRVVLDGSAQPGQEGGQVEVLIVGLSPFGFLLAQDGAGTSYELTPDGNSLDMMQGLLRRKLL